MKPSAILLAGLATMLLLPRNSIAQQTTPADPFVGNYLADGGGQLAGARQSLAMRQSARRIVRTQQRRLARRV